MRERLTELTGRIDRFQRERAWAGFPVAVWKKFSDDQAGTLAALIAYYAFVSIFPLLLILVTVLQIVLGHDEALRQKLVSSALEAYPVFGPELTGTVHPLTATGLALVIGLVGALLGARGVATAMQKALGAVWAIPLDRRARFPMSALRAIAMIAVIGIGQLLTAFLSGFAVKIGNVHSGFPAEAGAALVSFAANIGIFWLTFRLATSSQVSWRDLRLAAILSAFSWQVLLLLGSYIVGHLLHHSSAIYGVFGVVLGMLAWFYLQAQLTLYAIEAGVVRAWRLWPRGLAPPPTEQDQHAYDYYERAERQEPQE